MKKTKRFLVLLLAVFLVMSCISGCRRKPQDLPSPTSDESIRQELTQEDIEWAGQDPDKLKWVSMGFDKDRWSVYDEDEEKRQKILNITPEEHDKIKRLYDSIDEIGVNINTIKEQYKGDRNSKMADKVLTEVEEYLDCLKKRGTIANYEIDPFGYAIELPTGQIMVGDFGFFPELLNVIPSNNVNMTSKSSNKKSEVLQIITLSPFKDELTAPTVNWLKRKAVGYIDDSAKQIANTALGYEYTKCLNNSEVNIKAMKNLHEYRIILIIGHGALRRTWEVGPSFFESDNIICTSEKVEEDTKVDPDYIEDLEKKLIAITLDSNNNEYYGITKDFFDKYYTDNSLNHPLIYLGCCNSMRNNKMAEMLVKKGASVVLGFDNILDVGYAGNMCWSIFEKMTKSDYPNIQDAVIYAESKNGSNQDWEPWYSFKWDKTFFSDGTKIKYYPPDSTFSLTSFFDSDPASSVSPPEPSSKDPPEDSIYESLPNDPPDNLPSESISNDTPDNLPPNPTPDNDTQTIKQKIIGKWQVSSSGMSFTAEFFNDGKFKTDSFLVPSGTYEIDGNILTLITTFFGETFKDKSTIKFISENHFTLTGETGSFEEYNRIG